MVSYATPLVLGDRCWVGVFHPYLPQVPCVIELLMGCTAMLEGSVSDQSGDALLCEDQAANQIYLRQSLKENQPH